MRYVKLFMLLLLLALPLGLTKAQTQAPIIGPNIFIRGVQLPESVRYTATFIKPTDATPMKSLSVEVTLPSSAFFNEMYVSNQVNFDVIRLNKEQELTLIWQIATISETDALDAFAFTVQRPLNNPLEFYLKWTDSEGVVHEENFFDFPVVVDQTETDGSAFPVADAYSPVGNTGVQIASDNQANFLGVKVLPTDFNPPAEFSDTWWCSVVELLGLEQGKTAQVIVPLRRPLAPFTALQLFHQQADGSWLPIEGQQGIVTADGQYAMYTHPGGIVATGTEPERQLSIVAPENIVIEVVDDSAPVEEFPPVGSDTVEQLKDEVFQDGEQPTDNGTEPLKEEFLPLPEGVTQPGNDSVVAPEIPVVPAAGNEAPPVEPPPANEVAAENPPPAEAPPAEQAPVEVAPPAPQTTTVDSLIPVNLDPTARCDAAGVTLPVPNALITVPVFGLNPNNEERIEIAPVNDCAAVQCQVDGLLCAFVQRTPGSIVQ